jgi:hypothetical protein
MFICILLCHFLQVPAVVEALVLKYVALTHKELEESCLHKLFQKIMHVI